MGMKERIICEYKACLFNYSDGLFCDINVCARVRCYLNWQPFTFGYMYRKNYFAEPNINNCTAGIPIKIPNSPSHTAWKLPLMKFYLELYSIQIFFLWNSLIKFMSQKNLKNTLIFKINWINRFSHKNVPSITAWWKERDCDWEMSAGRIWKAVISLCSWWKLIFFWKESDTRRAHIYPTELLFGKVNIVLTRRQYGMRQCDGGGVILTEWMLDEKQARKG